MYCSSFWAAHVAGRPHNEQLSKQKFFCEPCQRQMYCAEYWDAHVNGSLHKEQINQQSAKDVKKERTTPPPVPKRQKAVKEENENKKAKDSMNKLYRAIGLS